MYLNTPGNPHLTYCTNIHPGETWSEVRSNLARYVVAVKSRIAPDQPFGVGLRLSAQAAETLAQPDELARFQDFLHAHGLYVFTINGFPYGPFHGQPVKEAVYRPDWLEDARLIYTDRLADLLAALLPAGIPFSALEGSISTVPLALLSRVTRDADEERLIELLVRHVARLCRIYERTGKMIALALEPEPCCCLQSVAETVEFFEGRLFTRSTVNRLSELTDLPREESQRAIRRHLGVCFDACHMAMEFIEPEVAVRRFQEAGIRILKIQISTGLKVTFEGSPRDRLDALKQFDDAVYLHQVVERRGNRLTHYCDLPEALEAALAQDREPREWRVHLHLPLFREQYGPFRNTQDYLRQLIGLLRSEPACQHLEVETYTWSVLPEEYRGEDMVASITRELEWVLEQLHGNT